MFVDVNSAELIQMSYCQYIHGACSGLPVLCPSFATESQKQVFPTIHLNNSVGKRKMMISVLRNFAHLDTLLYCINLQGYTECGRNNSRIVTTAAQALVVHGGPDLCP
jgi:hypothetical protein